MLIPNHQPQRGDARSSLPRSAPPVAWVGKPSRSTRFTTNYAPKRLLTTNQQPPTTNY
ncbi:MAG: hypothetical protein ACHBN1_32165 [Heteroscytonema crispum UTEX LB 1556]